MFLGEIKSCIDIRGGEETVQRLKTFDVATYGHKRSGSNMTHCRPAEHITLMPNATTFVLKLTVISLPYPFSIWSGKVHDLGTMFLPLFWVFICFLKTPPDKTACRRTRSRYREVKSSEFN